MRELIKSRIKKLLKDKIERNALLTAAALAACHAVIYYNDPTINNLSSLFFTLVFIPLDIIFGRSIMAPFFYIFSISILLTGGTYKNYSAAWFATLSITTLKPKYRPPLVLLHIAATIAVCHLHQKTPLHLTVYILNALFLYTATNILIKENHNSDPLDLTADERAILEELKHGKQQKEIELFSVNTITKKIRDARTRNGCETNTELLMKFIKENPL